MRLLSLSGAGFCQDNRSVPGTRKLEPLDYDLVKSGTCRPF